MGEHDLELRHAIHRIDVMHPFAPVLPTIALREGLLKTMAYFEGLLRRERLNFD